MDVPRSIVSFVIALVLGAVVYLAAGSFTSTQGNAALSVEKNFAQDSEIGIVKAQLEQVNRRLDRMEDQSDWSKDALLLLLHDRGLVSPK